MKVSLRWLRDYVPVALPAREIAHRLTMSGTEVGGVEQRGGDWEHVWVAEVVGVAAHPNADRLHLATVDLGGEQVTVVCGAPNLRSGARVALARPGARLIDGRTGQAAVVGTATIRGIASSGMLCSEKELGLSEEHAGILILPDEAPVGAALGGYLGDAILDLEVTPNRPDCLGVVGVAREVAALTGQEVRLPTSQYEEGSTPTADLVSVRIEDARSCPRYCAGIIRNLRVGPSPQWLQERLLAGGMRPVNNVVDVTNYVMLELGQPLHAFDWDRVQGCQIVVRRARRHESLRTLDGVDRELTPEMLLICDGVEPVAVAGVIGGEPSEVSGSTRHVLLECANFAPRSIRRTAARLRVRTEASLRFEKGLSPELAAVAIRRALGLLQELAGGDVCRGIVDAYPKPSKPVRLRFSRREVERLLGITFSSDEIRETLESLGFGCAAAGSALLVDVPYWRGDVRRVEDLVEEVARIRGYEGVPATALAGALPRYEPNPLADLRERMRDLLAGMDLVEVINYPLVSRAALERAGALGPEAPRPIALANAMSAEQEVLRTSMRPSLLATVAANQRHQAERISIFEMGKVYLERPGDLPEEREVVAVALWGAREEERWFGRPRQVDFFDGRGIAEELVGRLGWKAALRSASDDFFADGRAARLVVEEHEVGSFGEVSAAVRERFSIAGSVCYLEVRLDALLALEVPRRRFQSLPRQPAIRRDVALVVAEELPVERLVNALAGASLLEEVWPFDVYRGPEIPSGTKSVGVALRFRAADRTLWDEEVDRLLEPLLARIEAELGARRRE